MEPSTRILFVGHAWMGSSARSLREALAAIPSVYIDEVGEDLYVPRHRSPLLRLANRLLRPWQEAELSQEILARLDAIKCGVLIVYKGAGVELSVIREAKARGVFTVNVFPDCSPHAHGDKLKQAMGEYDLVVSTKPFHPKAWRNIYGYSNKCVCVPHGYDPAVHYWEKMPEKQDFDVVLAASWRPQYEKLMSDFALALGGHKVSLALVGPGWPQAKGRLPPEWTMTGPLFGRAYGEWVRRGKVVIAPVHSEIFVDGKQQPGDEDTTRTYELAASGCFFVHKRTPFVQTVYDEHTEVPMWGGAEELASQVLRYLPLQQEREKMALAAHQKAVPNYSIPSRAAAVLQEIRQAMNVSRS